jgi:hypothetical protein
MTARTEVPANLDGETIRALLAEHREDSAHPHIEARPGGGWLIITASHVLPDGSMDPTAGSTECLAMYDSDRTPSDGEGSS